MERTQHILIVDDHREIRELLAKFLTRNGLRVSVANGGAEMRQQLRAGAPDLIVLDIMMPGEDGLTLCRQVRQDSDIPIVLLTAVSEETDKIVGLELGADDYVTKPFSPRVLLARVRALLRRSPGAEDAAASGTPERLALVGGDLVIDAARHVVTCRGRTIDLTLTEFLLLQYLAQRPGFVRTRDQIIAAVHGRNTVLSSRTVDVHVTALRRKLGPLGECIETVRGVGYRFAEGVEAPAE